MKGLLSLSVTLIIVTGILISGCDAIDAAREKAEIKRYLAKVNDEDPAVRLEAINYLGKRPDYREIIITTLVEAFKDDDKEVRIAALAAMFWLRPEPGDVFPDLLEILREEDPEVRGIAAALLGGVNWDGVDVEAEYPELSGILIDMLKDSNIEVRSGVTLALINVGPFEDAKEDLISLLDDDDPAVRGRAAMALGKIGPKAKEAIPRIVEMLADEEYVASTFALDALGYFGNIAEDAVPSILAGINEGWIHPSDGAKVIGKLTSDQEVIDTLINWLDESEDLDQRVIAAGALGYVGPKPGVVDALIQALTGDEDSDVRYWVASSLGEMGPDPQVIDLLIAALDDGDWKVVGAAARALGNIGPPAYDALPKLEELTMAHAQFIEQDEQGFYSLSDTPEALEVISAGTAVEYAIKKIKGEDDG